MRGKLREIFKKIIEKSEENEEIGNLEKMIIGEGKIRKEIEDKGRVKIDIDNIVEDKRKKEVLKIVEKMIEKCSIEWKEKEGKKSKGKKILNGEDNLK